MPAVLCLLLMTLSPYVRVPDKTAAPALPANLAWVFFTDKGIFDDAGYGSALRSVATSMPEDAAARRRLNAVAGPDFDDLPVRESYIAQVEAAGARLRTVSKWLNAASFYMTPEVAARVYALPFVYDLRPVAVQTTAGTDFFPLGPAARADSRAVDTATSHRFYGPSWDQAQMMGVPDVFFRGYFGSNVKLAIFDTGIKLYNRGIAKARIYRQHDFLSGDNLCVARAANGWIPEAVSGVRFQGLVGDPAVSVVQSASGSRDTALLVFAGDSFAYGYNPPRRALLAAFTTDAGISWSAPAPIALSRTYNQTYENASLANHGHFSYVACNDLTALSPNPAGANVHLGYFAGSDWVGPLDLIGAGRYPTLAVTDDTLYLAFVQGDTSLVVSKFSVALAEPAELSTSSFALNEPLVSPQIVPGADGIVDVVVTGRNTGRVLQFRSTDGGASFALLNELVATGAGSVRLASTGQSLVALYEDRGTTPFSRLAALRSTDGGSTWLPGDDVVDSIFSVGGFSIVADGQSAVSVAFETGGFAYRTSTTDLGESWATPQLLDTTGFNLPPVLANVGTSTIALWFKRGDDQAVWESSDTLKFSREQPHHGTRMASIIAGYQQGAVVGIAPGVDLLVAKTELYKTRSGRPYEYSMEEDAYVEAFEWADRMGADIVSTSLGYRAWYGDDQFDGKTAPISVAASLAARRGMLIVTAMGNRDTSYYPWPKPYIVAPGDADGVITAGGVEKNISPWRGTGTGPTSDGRIKPDLVALSDTVAVVSPDSIDYLDGSVGTSCATALIAGACALIKEAHPTWSADSIKAVLFATASRSVKSCTFGFGVPHVDSAYKLYPPEKGIDEVAGDEIGAIFPNPYVPAKHGRLYFQINLTRPAFEAKISIFSPSGMLVDTVTLNAGLMSRPGRYGDKGDVELIERIGAFWDGKNESGKPVAAGLYVAVLQTTFGRRASKFAVVR